MKKVHGEYLGGFLSCSAMMYPCYHAMDGTYVIHTRDVLNAR